MFKKFGIGMLAAALAVAFSAFTATKKVQTTTAKTENMYWYKVVGNVIPQNAPLIDHTSKDQVEVPCDPGTARDCIRGFDDQLITSAGPTYGPGDDEVKTNDPDQ